MSQVKAWALGAPLWLEALWTPPIGSGFCVCPLHRIELACEAAPQATSLLPLLSGVRKGQIPFLFLSTQCSESHTLGHQVQPGAKVHSLTKPRTSNLVIPALVCSLQSRQPAPALSRVHGGSAHTAQLEQFTSLLKTVSLSPPCGVVSQLSFQVVSIVPFKA